MLQGEEMIRSFTPEKVSQIFDVKKEEAPLSKDIASHDENEEEKTPVSEERGARVGGEGGGIDQEKART